MAVAVCVCVLFTNGGHCLFGTPLSSLPIAQNLDLRSCLCWFQIMVSFSWPYIWSPTHLLFWNNAFIISKSKSIFFKSTSKPFPTARSFPCFSVGSHFWNNWNPLYVQKNVKRCPHIRSCFTTMCMKLNLLAYSPSILRTLVQRKLSKSSKIKYILNWVYNSVQVLHTIWKGEPGEASGLSLLWPQHLGA